MRFSTMLGLAGLAAAVPLESRLPDLKPRAGSGPLNVVYWGQNGGGTIENNDLSAYCQADSGIDVLVLAFLYQFGNGNLIPGGTIGQSCYIASSSGQGQNCDALASSIKTCQDNGVKIILSLGGAAGSYSVTSQSDAETIADNLWASYGKPGSSSAQRPFGSSAVDGFDFDLEVNPSGNNKYYQYMIAKLRSHFAEDSSRQYYITGAPQCPIPEPNMSVVIESSQFDMLFIQFYNNNNYTVPCALGINGDAPLNFNNWTNYIQDTPSKGAKLFIGAPASTLGANGAPSGEVYYATPDQLSGIVNEYKSDASFGGVMLWAAGFSDANVNDGCTYAQEVKNILVNGKPCGNGPSVTKSASAPTSTATGGSGTQPTSTASAPASTATGLVAQWGQCGGQGWTGPTQCQPPYKCTAGGQWYSDCR